jgi:AcrR family transcriptional regulator
MEYNEKQVQIMEAAEVLFAEGGFNGTSVRDIAEKANVNLAMISYYFGSKEKLLEALFAYRGENLKVQMESMLQNDKMSALQKVYFLIGQFVEKIMKQQCFQRIMVREQVLNHNGPLENVILKMKKNNLDLIRRLIQEGQKKGEFKKNIDISLMMSTMIGTANHLLTTQHYYRELNNLKEMPEEEFQKLIKKKLSIHLKLLFKAILTYE